MKTTQRSETSTALHQSSSVAIVDDDERFREAPGFELQTVDFKVDTFWSAEISSRHLKQGSLIASRQSRPFASMIVIPGRGDLSLGVQAMRKGAVDCPEKPIENASSLWVVKCGVELFRLNRAHLLAANGIGGAGENFNQREREVFALITSGQLNKQVGAELGSSEPEVKKHRSPVINKMGAASLAELVRMAETLRIHSRGSLPEEASDCHL